MAFKSTLASNIVWGGAAAIAISAVGAALVSLAVFCISRFPFWLAGPVFSAAVVLVGLIIEGATRLFGQAPKGRAGR